MKTNPRDTLTESIGEYTKERLRKDGYDLLLKTIETVKLAEPYKTEEHLAIDFTDNYRLDVWLKDGEKKSICRPVKYGERSTRILIYALYLSVKNKWFENPVSRYDFKKTMTDDCPNINSPHISTFLDNQFTKAMFEIDTVADTIKLKFIPKEILGVEELKQWN